MVATSGTYEAALGAFVYVFHLLALLASNDMSLFAGWAYKFHPVLLCLDLFSA